MTGRRLHRILLGVALALWTAAAGATTQKCDLIYYTKRFISKGKSIRAEIVRPSYGTHPAVLFIHGTGGLLTRAALERRSVPPVDENFGEYELACRGYVVILIHYFDATEMVNVEDVSVIHRNARIWLSTLQLGLAMTMRLPHVKRASKIGIIGESLGGYIGLALATEDQRIGAVVIAAAGIPDVCFQHPERLPPVLVLHGEEDSVVPTAEAYKLTATLRKFHVRHQLRILRRAHHALLMERRSECIELSCMFLSRYISQRVRGMGGPF